MGKKIRGKAHVRDTLPVEEKNVEDGLRKRLSRQARSEVSNLVEKLMKGKLDISDVYLVKFERIAVVRTPNVLEYVN
jgi:hypothetical protein